MSRFQQRNNKRTGGQQRGLFFVGVAVLLGLLILIMVLQGNNNAETTLVYLSSSLQSSSSSQSSPPSSSSNNNNNNHDFALATYESYGFFTDIAASDWTRLQQRVQEVYPNTIGSPAALKQNSRVRASDFYQDHYEPEFTCRHERRVGKRGDGGKWVCDPFRLQNKPDCLVYSVGSEGDASFEAAVLAEIGPHCEIHTFDMGPYRAPVEKAGSHFHQWGIAAQSTLDGTSYTGPGKQRGRGQFKSLQETIKLLNHTGRTIDLFKIDCEYCEWEVFPAFFEAGVHLQQVLIELHAFQKPMPMPQTVNFFEAMFQHGYVIFHKEVNIKHWVGEAIEYAFVKLRPEFFAGIPKQEGEAAGAAPAAAARALQGMPDDQALLSRQQALLSQKQSLLSNKQLQTADANRRFGHVHLKN